MTVFAVLLDGLLCAVSPAPGCPAVPAPHMDAELQSLVLVAAAESAVTRGDDLEALACLDAARARDASALVSEERAFVLYRLERYEEALGEIRRALEFGEVDPEARLLEAEILTVVERFEEAKQAARRSASWEGGLVGASLEDAAAAYEAVEYVDERTERGALSALVLGARALEQGRLRAARAFLSLSQKSAELAATPGVGAVAADLLERARDISPWRWSAHLGSSLDFASNPGYRARGDPELERGLRVALSAEGGLAADVGAIRALLAMRIDQQLFLAPRDVPAGLDVFGLAVAGALEWPLTRDPSFVLLGISVRFSNLYGDRFAVHHAVSFEGGPYLKLRLGPELWMTLGFFGVLTNFIDGNPEEEAFSSLDRDRSGQRGLLGIRYVGDWLDVWVDGMFIRDDAVGDAFDGIGGAAAVRLEARPGVGLGVFAGLALTATEYGPVGDLAIIGPAATRAELRTVAEVGVRFALWPHLDFIVKDTWINNAARTGHGYTENVLSMGFDAWW